MVNIEDYEHKGHWWADQGNWKREGRWSWQEKEEALIFITE